MTEEQFKYHNVAFWTELEALNANLSKKRAFHMKKERITRFAYLLQKASHDLAYVRTHFGEGETSHYLNQLIAVSHNYFYLRDKNGFTEVLSYFLHGFRNLVVQHLSFVYISFVMFMLGALGAATIVAVEPSNMSYFMDEQSAEQIDLATEFEDGGMMAFMSAYVMTNNIRVCALAIAWGITLGIGTIYIMIINGAIVGSLWMFLVGKFGVGVNLSFWALILPHGFIELTAIFISGAVGILIGKSIITPGNLRRRDALIKSAKTVALFLPGIAGMLVIAGIIEGFVTPSFLSPKSKIVFAFITLALTILYFAVPRKNKMMT